LRLSGMEVESLTGRSAGSSLAFRRGRGSGLCGFGL